MPKRVAVFVFGLESPVCKPAFLTGSADSDGRRSDTGGAPIVRFFVAARSAASLVSTLESKNTNQPARRRYGVKKKQGGPTSGT